MPEQGKPEELLSRVRRTDRAVDDEEWIAAELERASHGYLATEAGGQPFLLVGLFAFDRPARALYLHTAIEGRARKNLLQNARVCFAVARMGRLLPASQACGFSVEYSSVIAFGSAEILQGSAEATRGLRLLLEKYFPHLPYGQAYAPVTEADLKRTTVIRIRIQEWSGKRKAAAPDFPGALEFPPSWPH
jgi:nitroimidazol reductase NimA-like FMN-containing flavoprotein (pyridoxamine 5'-phosphate oxidase superfamily)